MLLPLVRQSLEDEWMSMGKLTGFTKAVYANPGDPITSRQHNLFARAVNERILSGLGDAHWRIAWYLLSLFRSMVVSDTSGLQWHSESEYFEVFQMMAANVATWPENGLGEWGLPEPEGPNTFNAMMAWVYGMKQVDLDDEATRLGRVPVALNVNTAAEKWAQGKLQRGGADLHGGLVVSPVMDCAWEFARLAYMKNGFHNLSYGGFLPGPDRKGDACYPPCDPSTCQPNTRTNLEIFFTSTRPDVSIAGLNYETTEDIPWVFDPLQNVKKITYAGTCLECDDYYADPPNPRGCPDYTKHILVYYELPDGWHIVLNEVDGDGNHTVDFLPRNDWIEGPYTQCSALARDYGDQVRRSVNAFNRDFRGSDAQRSVEGYNLEFAADIQRFYTTQYALSPQFAIRNGNELTVKYPAWTLGPGAYSEGDALSSNYGAGSYSGHEGYVTTHVYAELVSAVPGRVVGLTLTHSGGTVSLAASADGSIVALELAGRLIGVDVVLSADTTLAAGESITVEINEVVEYKPNWYDLYVLLRKGGAKLVGSSGETGDDPNFDGTGSNESFANEISDGYFDNGAILNVHDRAGISEPTSVNENAVYESARRLSQVVRIMNRFALIDYAVVGGDSVLWFTPHPRTGDYPMTSPASEGEPLIDLFEGLTVNEEAEDGQFNSRWVFDVWLKPYSTDEVEGGAYPMRIDLYGDQIPDVDRCVVNDTVMIRDKSFADHVNRGTDDTPYGIYFAQSPSGWRYAQMFDDTTHVNHDVGETDEVRIAFAKSCRIYEPPLEIRSVERVTECGRELVKVTLKGRLHSSAGETGGAPADVPRSGYLWGASNWDHSTISAEPFASTERGLRLYLIHRNEGTHAGTLKPGDHALTSSGVPSVQKCAIIPHFVFVKLIPEAVIDDNEDQEDTDSLFLHDHELQAEWYLRCMSEGYVCENGALDCSTADSARQYDWTWRNLCVRLFGLPSVGSFPLIVPPGGVSTLEEADVRSDGPEGFGPLPNTYAASEVFNRLVRIVNKLYFVRVMLPWAGQYTESEGYASRDVPDVPDGDYGCGISSSACDSATGKIATNLNPPGVYSLTVTQDWTDFVDGYLYTIALTDAAMAGCTPPTTTQWQLVSYRRTAAFRFDLVDPHIYLHAIPEAWRGMVNEASEWIGGMFSTEQTKGWCTAREGETICSGWSFSCAFDLHTEISQHCLFLRNGAYDLNAGANPIGGWFVIDREGGCNYGSINRLDIYYMAGTCPVMWVPVVDREE